MNLNACSLVLPPLEMESQKVELMWHMEGRPNGVS